MWNPNPRPPTMWKARSVTMWGGRGLGLPPDVYIYYNRQTVQKKPNPDAATVHSTNVYVYIFGGLFGRRTPGKNLPHPTAGMYCPKP